MKKTITGISSLVLLLGGAFALAEMNGGMTEGQNKSMLLGQMSGQGGMTEYGQMQGGMMEHGQMMGGMMGMSNQMSAMMGKMSGMMKNMPPDKMKRMSGVMKDMSHQMLEMSTAMDSGKVSAGEMKKMQDRMIAIQKEMSGMEMRQ